MKRAIALSLILLISAEAGFASTTELDAVPKTKIQRKRKKIKKYSRAWWRMHRARQRRARIYAARRLELAANRQPSVEPAQRNAAVNQQVSLERNNSGNLEVAIGGNDGSNTRQYVARNAVKLRRDKKSQPVTAPVLGKDAPAVSAMSNNQEFRLADHNGQQIGSAQLSMVGVAMPQNEEGASEHSRKQMLAGVPVSTLRRTVIDRMMKENGWVVNDFQREVAGKKVFVVVAQSSAPNGVVQSRQFYFTEVDGRIYNLATNAPADFGDQAAADSEKLLRAMINKSTRPTQTAENR